MELLHSIRQIFSDYLPAQGCDYYNIPEYQRGYKWTDNNVIQLLNDLKEFKKNTSDDFYCLQNITVTLNLDKKCINLIDGQQRITTLFIILCYLQKATQEKYVNDRILKYSVRESTHEFLTNEVLSGEIWDSDIIPENMTSKDQFYIALVCKAIKEWFTTNSLDDISVILDSVKLIVNVIDKEDQETVFASLNGGKVDLDGADLIRAILITKASKEKYTDNLDREKVSNFRIKLGIELDEMNNWWSHKDVELFFVQLLPIKISKNQSFKYSKYPIDLLYFAFFEAYNEYFETKIELNIRHFENGIDINKKSGDNYIELYNEIYEFHLTMVDWYKDDEIYNLLGYLMSNFKAKINFSSLWSYWKEFKTKTEFKNKLKDEIKKQVANASSNDDESKVEENWENLKDTLVDFDQTNWYDSDLTKIILPLMDILPYENKKSSIKRVDIADFKYSNIEDKEHVRSQTRKLDEDNLTDEENEQLKEDNRHGLNSIGNLVLLHQTINRSYRNNNICIKMDRIISESLLNNIHIRPHTFNVFCSKLKTMDKNGTILNEAFWSEDDIRNNAKKISEGITNYLCTK